MRNSFQKFNLDEIEYSLYAIIIVVSPGKYFIFNCTTNLAFLFSNYFLINFEKKINEFKRKFI